MLMAAQSAEKWRTQDMGVDFLDRRVLPKRVVDGRKPASGHESQWRQGVASGHPQGRSAAKEPRSGLTRLNPLTLDPTCCGFSHSLFAIYVRFYAAVNKSFPKKTGSAVIGCELPGSAGCPSRVCVANRQLRVPGAEMALSFSNVQWYELTRTRAMSLTDFRRGNTEAAMYPSTLGMNDIFL